MYYRVEFRNENWPEGEYQLQGFFPDQRSAYERADYLRKIQPLSSPDDRNRSRWVYHVREM